ncbi:MAG: transcriptional regulator with PAS, ATPase and Fis domain [Crocinitomicaceae bacterium]|jgi:transcriptional regulator with PAS, ATPase and Fis domain
MSKELRIQAGKEVDQIEALLSTNLKDEYQSLLLVQTAFNTLEDLYIITDSEGVALLANDPLEKVYHVNSDDIIGQNIRAFFEHDEMAAYNLDFSSCLPLSEQFSSSYSESRTKNEHIEIKISNQVVSLKDGYGLMYKIKPVNIKVNSKEAGIEVAKKYKDLVTNLSSQPEALLKGIMSAVADKDNLLSQIRQIFEDKPRKNLTEIAFLRALEEIQ